MGLLWRLFAPRPLKRARRALHPSWVIEDATVRGGIDRLSTAGNNIKTAYDKRYVDNGKIITTAGLSSGIDGALHVVSKMFGPGKPV